MWWLIRAATHSWKFILSRILRNKKLKIKISAIKLMSFSSPSSLCTVWIQSFSLFYRFALKWIKHWIVCLIDYLFHLYDSIWAVCTVLKFNVGGYVCAIDKISFKNNTLFVFNATVDFEWTYVSMGVCKQLIQNETHTFSFLSFFPSIMFISFNIYTLLRCRKQFRCAIPLYYPIIT